MRHSDLFPEMCHVLAKVSIACSGLIQLEIHDPKLSSRVSLCSSQIPFVLSDDGPTDDERHSLAHRSRLHGATTRATVADMGSTESSVQIYGWTDQMSPTVRTMYESLLSPQSFHDGRKPT